MLRAALVIVLSGLVAACGQQTQDSAVKSGPALDFIEATPIAEGALIEGPASPRAPQPVSTAAATAPPPDRKSAEASDASAELSPRTAPDPGAGTAPSATASREAAPAPTAGDQAVEAAKRAAAASATADAAARAARAAGEAADPARTPPPQTPN
jgi:hypothetical protein